MQIHELACSSMCLHAVQWACMKFLSLSEQLTRISQCLFWLDESRGSFWGILLLLALLYQSTPSCLRVRGGGGPCDFSVLLVLTLGLRTLGLQTQAWQLYFYNITIMVIVRGQDEVEIVYLSCPDKAFLCRWPTPQPTLRAWLVQLLMRQRQTSSNEIRKFVIFIQ